MANRQKAVKMASRGASAKEIRQTTGVTGQAARNIVSRVSTPAPVQTNAGPNPMGTRTHTPTTTKPTTLTQGLKIAGTGGITKQDLNTILDTTGKSGEKVIQRLDALNQKLKGKDQVGISLNSGAANMLIKQAQKAYTRNPFTMPMQFGTGQIGKSTAGNAWKHVLLVVISTLKVGKQIVYSWCTFPNDGWWYSYSSWWPPNTAWLW
jgi:hypothetical protein